jgi:hypothetical protein
MIAPFVEIAIWFSLLRFMKKLISLQRNRVRAVKQKAHTRQSALGKMRSEKCELLYCYECLNDYKRYDVFCS